MPTATFPTWGKTTKPEPTFPTFPTWGKQPATPTDTFDTQVEVFNEHLQEFYHQDRGNQTYLDFLGKTYPQDAGQLTPDFITAINQTQPEFLGTQADYLKAHPVEQTLLDKLKGFGVGVLNTAIKGLEYGVWPFTAFGIALHEYDKELEAAKAAGEPTPPLQMPATLEEFKEWFPGGKTYEEYQKLSFGRQLFYEAPAWATTLLLPSATSLRATLAGTAGAGGVKGAVATVGGIALKPLAGYEAIIGKITGGITNKIISVAQQRAIRTALRKGAARAGIDLTTEAENALILAYRTSLEQHINSELVAWMARNAGIELSDKVQEKVINYLLTHASPEWSAGKMLDALEGVISGRLITASAEKTATATARMVPIALSQSIAPTTTTGITEWGAVTGAVAGVQLNPITTKVGKGYEIIQNGEPVGEISYNPNFPGVEGIVIDRIDIVETARRQGLATQAIQRVLGEAEASGVPLYTGMLEPDGVKLMNALEQRGIVSLTPAPMKMLGEEVTRGVPQYAETTAMEEWEAVSPAQWEAITGEIPPQLTKKQITELEKPIKEAAKTGLGKLRQKIMAIAKTKGLSENQYRGIYKAAGGTKSLTSMDIDKLRRVLGAITRARPITIGQKKVVSPRTEQEIQTLKQALINEKKITQADYDAILRMLKLSTDKYTDKSSFITETQGRNIIKAMKRKSLMGYAFIEQRINELNDAMAPPDEPPRIITSEALKQPFGANFIDKIEAFTIRSYRMERILYRMDGYEDTGLWQDTFYKPVNDATSARIGEVIDWQDKFLQFTKDNKINIGKLFTTKEDFDGVILTSAEKIGLYQHSLNPDNLRHLKVGNRFSDAQIKKIVDSLTPDEKAVIKFQQDYFKQRGTSVAETFKYMTGKELDLVENYFPIKIDWRADPEIDWWQLVSLADSQQFMAKWASSMIPKGFLSARTHAAVQAVNLDAMSIWWNHLELTAHYKNFAPVINDLQLIMQNPKFKYNLQNTQGRHLYQVLDKWIKQVADVNPLRATNYAEQMLRTLRVNAVAAVLGVNITTALKQFPSFVSSMSEAGVIPVMRGLFTFMAHPKETVSLMKQLSPQIYARTMEREIAEARLKASLDKKLTRKLSPREAFMILTTTMDRLAVNSIWRGAFDEHLRKNPNAVEEAAEYASRVIRRTQPFFSVKDLAEYYRSGEFMKVLTIFTNQLNQYWNMARFEMFGKFGAKPGAKGFGELVKKLILGIVIPSIMIGIITRASLPKDKEDAIDKTKDDVVRTGLSVIPILGQWLSAGFQGWQEGQGLISIEIFKQFQEAVYNFNEQEWNKLAQQAPEFMGYLLGIPVAQPKRTIEGIIAFAKGETDDWLRLIYSGYTVDAAYRELMESWQPDFDDYYAQPSPRYDYREANPEVDAKLFISNKVSTLQSDEARNIVLRLIEENDIDVRRINAYEKIFGEEAEKPEGEGFPSWGEETKEPSWGTTETTPKFPTWGK